MNRRNTESLPRRILLGIVAAVLVPGLAKSQLTTGTLQGTLRDAGHQPLAGISLAITGALDFTTVIRSDARGEFSAALPYGPYRVSTGKSAGVAVEVAPLQTVYLNLVLSPDGLRVQTPDTNLYGPWAEATRQRVYPSGLSLQSLLNTRGPASEAAPIDFTGLNDNRLFFLSQQAASWTTTQYKLLGMDTTDSYQPGSAVALPDLQETESVVVRSGFTQTASDSFGTEVGIFPVQAAAAWHFALTTSGTTSAFAASNLPPAADRGAVEQDWHYQWLTRDGFEAGGPISDRADLYASTNAQWSSQTVPLQPAGTDQSSRLLFENVRGRFRAGSRDRLDGLFSGSQIALPDWGEPVGLEALLGRRMAPTLLLPGGFPQESEADRFSFLQGGWSHWFAEESRLGILEVRYGYSSAHLNTQAPTGPFGEYESTMELTTGQVTEAPPLANAAVRTRQDVEGTWQPRALRFAGAQHQIIAGAGWKSSAPLNRFTIPSDINLITAAGTPAFVVEFNTPLESRSIIRAFTGYVADRVTLTRSFSLDLGLLGDFSRGSLPAQSSGGGRFSSPSSYAARPDLIVWNSLSPRANFAWQLIHTPLTGVGLMGGWFRLYAPLAGRDLDFGNPNSLSGSVYRWMDSNAGGQFEMSEQGPLLMRFGGEYSSIAPSLRRPYADEIHLGARASIGQWGYASLLLWRRDDEQRVAGLDVGVPAEAYTPVTIFDPLTNQPLTVYQQNPATFGQDRYLLTNPPGLRTFNAGWTAELDCAWRTLTVRVSFTAEKSYGLNNPGNSILQGDSGVVGSLFLDPNTTVNAEGRNYLDPGYIGKAQATYRLPSWLGGIEVASTFNYMDGLAFGGQILVTGLAQGPFLVMATVSEGVSLPGGGEAGYRADYVANWNLRLQRAFPLAPGKLTASAEILNVLNAASIVQENGYISNPRSPLAFQEPRWALLELRYEY